ncbi:MAG: hypothetical protein QHJ73_09910, partial [Armatimonadota bacterium]|nr:hypothetical protein [Armatimonadota bacterium]
MFVHELMAASLAVSAFLADESTPRREVIELRRYTFASEAKLESFDAFLAAAMIPALQRAGVGPVGVFRLKQDENPDARLDW